MHDTAPRPQPGGVPRDRAARARGSRPWSHDARVTGPQPGAKPRSRVVRAVPGRGRGFFASAAAMAPDVRAREMEHVLGKFAMSLKPAHALDAKRYHENVDAVVAADCVYSPETAKALVATVRSVRMTSAETGSFFLSPDFVR